MREILKSFPGNGNPLFTIELCGTSYCDGSYRINRHNSPIYCFEYIISGTGTVVDHGRKYHPEACDVYFLRRGDDHLYYSDADNPWTKIWFNIKGELVDRLVELYGIGDRRVFHNCRIFSLFDEFVKNANGILDRRSIEKRNAILLHEIIQEMSACIQTDETGYTDDAVVLREYIEAKYDKQLSIEELSGLIFRSQSQTIRIFKSNFGVTPYEYALNRKMHVAKQLLRSTRMPVREISAQLGFLNEHYFSSSFKHHTGISPIKYRKNEK